MTHNSSPFRFVHLKHLGAFAAMLIAGFIACTPGAAAQEVYLVNLTAQWCPNCRILDPRLEEAADRFQDGSIKRVTMDFTNSQTMADTFERVNGTMVAGVFADYAGLTGLGVLVSVDSGETIECLNRTMTTDLIEMQILAAREIVRTQPIGKRQTGSVMCPPPNKRVTQ